MRVYKRGLISILLIFGLIFIFSYLPGKNLDSSLRNTVMDNLKISQSNVLYNENFDDGTADSWKTLGGTWTVENNQYKVTGTSQECVRSYYTAETFYYYIYEGDFKLISGDEIQLIFNIHDIFYGADQGHYCQITLFYDDRYGDRKDTAILYSTQNGQIEHKRVSYDFNYNQWYHFSVVSTGETVEFFLNNSLVLSYSGVFYYSGYIGIKSMFGPIVYWDNIMVIGFNYSEKIHINGNSDWAELKNAGNCSGQGTYSNPYVIEDLIINAEGSGTCLLIENSNVYFKIENCIMVNSGIGHTGIILSNVSNGKLINTTINFHAYGITLGNSKNNTLIGNSACYNNNDGMLISNSNNNIFLDNNIEDNNFIGLRLEFCNNNMITENSIKNNWEGISLSKSNENSIWGNNISYNDIGIYCYDSFNCNISGNIINNNDYGLEYSDNNKNHTISGNIINNNRRGICLTGYYNNYNNISENTINFNEFGLFFHESQNNLILGNEINGNSQYGICLSYSDYNVIKFNQITNNYIGIYIFYSNYNEILNNTFNGNTINVKEYTEIQYPYPYENIIIFISVITVIIIIAVVLAKRKHSRHKFFTIEKPKEKFQLIKEPIIEKNLEPDRETELLIHSQVETITNLQKDKVVMDEPEEKEKEIISPPLLVKGEKETEIEQPTTPKLKTGKEELIQDEKEFLPLEPIPIIKVEESSEDRGKKNVKKRYCTNCGKLLEPNWKICPYCGVKVWKDMWKDKLTLEDEKILIEKKAISQPEPSSSVIIKSKIKDEELVESIELSSSIETREKKSSQDGLVQSQIEKRDIPKPMKNLCPFCGYENKLNKAYCYQCGYRLVK